MQSRSKNRPAFLEIQTIDKHIDQAILWITFGTLLIIPILFSYFDITAIFSEPRIVALHLASALIAILWIWQIAIRMINPILPKIDPLKSDLLKWAGRNPARWALIGAAIWFFAQIASTLLSPLPIISFFGYDEASSGYNLYDSLSLGILFLSIALRFRSIQTLTLLTYALVITGTITASYGIAQHFNWDPIGGNIGLNRVQSSFGNTLNYYYSTPFTKTIKAKKAYNGFVKSWDIKLIPTYGYREARDVYGSGRSLYYDKTGAIDLQNNLNVTNNLSFKEEVINFLGEPNFIDPIEKKYYYYSEKKYVKNFFKQKISNRIMVVFIFNENETIKSVSQYDLNDEQDVKNIKESTPNELIKRGLIQKIFGGIGNTMPSTTE